MPPAQSRVSDLAKIDSCAHGCPGCPHTCTGPVVQGSPNVNVNSLAAARVSDLGIHAACCGPNMYTKSAGSGTVFINGKAAIRKDDADTRCGGSGKMTQGSPNVFTGG